MTTIDDIIAQAIGDPGSVVPREGDDETVTRWSTRAVAAALRDNYGLVDGYVATRALVATASLTENATLRTERSQMATRLRAADDLLHEANGLICSAENLKLAPKCMTSHCVDGDHVMDMRNPVPIGDQDWRDAQRRWADRWHEFIRSDRPAGCIHCLGLDGTHTLRDCEGAQ